MTYDEAIKKTIEDRCYNAIHKGLKKKLMKKVYHKVCRKIDCQFCIIGQSCDFKGWCGRDFNYALQFITEDDILKVIGWSGIDPKDIPELKES